MQLKLSPYTPTDSAGMIRVMFSAFSSDDRDRALYNDNAEDRAAAQAWMTEKTTEAFGCDVSERSLKVVDEDNGEIVGTATWIVPHKFTEEEAKRAHDSPLHAVPPTANAEFFKDYFGELLRRRNANRDKEKDFVINLLVVTPSYQGKGVGSLLMKWGTSEADNVDARCYVESSPAGLPVYKKYGFQEIPGEVIEHKLSDYGYHKLKGDGMSRVRCMTRPRKSERQV